MNRLLFSIYLLLIMTMSTEAKIKAADEPKEQSPEELYQDLFISLLSTEIDKPIMDYYTKTLTYLPMVYPYEVHVEEAKRLGGYRSFEFLVTLQVTPVVGPHIAVGEDRLTLYISGDGQVQQRKFEHIKSYELPEHWQHIKKNRTDWD